MTHCTLCHLPPVFSDTLFHNMGVGSDKTPADPGRGKVLADQAKAAGKPAPPEAETLIGAFKTGSLRGLMLRAPYFHDGRAKTYDLAAATMLAGGIANPHKDDKLKKWEFTEEQKTLLLAFLRSISPSNSSPYVRPGLP